MLRVLSVPQFYDFEIFSILANRFNAGYPIANFNNFNVFSFIKHDDKDKLNDVGKYIIHILMRDEIKKRLDCEMKRSVDVEMIDYFKEKLAQKKIAIEDIRYYFKELLYHLIAAENQEQLLERIENEFISVIKRIQVSGETKYLPKRFA